MCEKTQPTLLTHGTAITWYKTTQYTYIQRGITSTVYFVSTSKPNKTISTSGRDKGHAIEDNMNLSYHDKHTIIKCKI